MYNCIMFQLPILIYVYITYIQLNISDVMA